MANAFAVLGGMQRLAAALTEAGRRGGFPAAEAETLVTTARGLWRSRSIIETALDAEARRRAALAIAPPSPGIELPQSPAPQLNPSPCSRALGMKEAAERLGCERMAMTARAKKLGLVSLVDGQWRVSENDLPRLKPVRREAMVSPAEAQRRYREKHRRTAAA
jgi:hypothetical protein